MVVRCPRCGTEVPFEGNPFRPFCGARCREIDLGRWLSESHRLGIEADEPDAGPAQPDADEP